MRRAALALGVSLGAVLLASGPVWGADEASIVAKAAVDTGGVNIADNVEQQMIDYIRHSGLGAREQAGEISIVHGKSMVAVAPTSPDWVAERALAYDEALMLAITDYVISQGVSITNDAIKSTYQAGHSDPPPYDNARDPGQAAELLRKVLALGNAQVDTELVKLGVDPKQYADAAPPQKHVQLRNALVRNIMRTAFGNLVGLTPVQTFEGSDGKGIYDIGVVAVVSPALRDFAQNVMRLHGEFPADPSRAQDIDKVLSDKTALLHDFGVRRLFDENGLPVIVSFAQWAPQAVDADPAVNEVYRDNAFRQAEARADGQIADFLTGTVSYQESGETGHALEKIAEQSPEYTKQDLAVKSVVNQSISELRLHSHVTLTGIETLSKWGMNHPENGRPVVGVVRMWSATAEKSIRGLQDGRRSGAGVATPAHANGPAGVTTGQELMKPGDF